MSAENEPVKKRIESAIGVISEREHFLSDLETQEALFKKWGIAGYLKVNMNEANIYALQKELQNLIKRNRDLKEILEQDEEIKLLIEEKEENGQETLNAKRTKKWQREKSASLDGVKRRLDHLLQIVDKELAGMRDRSKQLLNEHEKRIKEKVANNGKAVETIRAKVEYERDEEYNKRFNQGLFNLLNAKVLYDPLTDSEAEHLQRKQAALDEMRILQDLCAHNILNINDMPVKGVGSLVGKGLLTSKQLASTAVAGASELASELYYQGLNTAFMFLAWPVTLPVKLINVFILTPIRVVATSLSVTVDELLFKPFIAPAWEWFKKGPEGNAGWVTLGIVSRIFAAPFIGAGALVTGVCKAAAWGSEQAKKYFNFDTWVRRFPSGAALAGAIGAPTTLLLTMALLIAAPFTFGITGAVLIGLWAAFGLGTAVGIGVAVKKAKDAAKAEYVSKLTPEESAQLMEWEHRHGKKVEVKPKQTDARKETEEPSPTVPITPMAAKAARSSTTAIHSKPVATPTAKKAMKEQEVHEHPLLFPHPTATTHSQSPKTELPTSTDPKYPKSEH